MQSDNYHAKPMEIHFQSFTENEDSLFPFKF